MKKLFSILLTLAMVLSLVTVASAQEVVGSDATAVGALGDTWARRVYELVAEYSNGELTVDNQGNSTLGGDADVLRYVADGDVAFSTCQTAPIVSFIPEMAVFDLPMVFAKYDAAKINEVLNGENEFTAKLREAYETAGYHLLGFLQGATFRLTTSNVDISTIEGFQGLKIRTMENQNHMAFWTALGANPTPMAWTEVPFALQTGAIDAQENAADTCASSNFQEVQKYLACTNHILYCNQMCVNKEFWDGLTPEVQEALNKAVTDATAECSAMAAQVDAENKQKMIDGGITLITYEPEFYDTILANEGVQALYTKIDTDTNGLASLLVAELAK